MNIKYLEAKNGERTFSIDSIMFHSLYSPDKEAQRFTENLEFPVSPKIIILIEPGYSYCYKYLKQKFPDSKIGIIRLIDNFSDSKSEWDFIINKEPIDDYLFKHFSEDEIIDTLLFTWNSASTIFKDNISEIYNNWKAAIKTSRTLLITRQYFEKKWVINACNFFKYLNKTANIHKINLPVVITASGPSLKNQIPFIKQNREKFFLAALSSSVSVLLKNEIKPDLIFTTDGGFWAGKHLNKIDENIVLACSQESYIPKKLLKKNPVLPLTYTDGVTKDFYSILNIKAQTAQRNPTVSGTALEFIKGIAGKEIYFFGLDMNNTRGFSHTQPNYFETESSSFDNRIKSKETRIIRNSFSSSQLELYKRWFEQLTDTDNIFRVIDNPLNKLGKIRDIKTMNINHAEIITNFFNTDICTADIQKLYNHIKSIWNSEAWKKQIFPADFVAINHSNDEAARKKLINQLEEKNKNLQDKIRKILSNE